jgi:hypothetical protein
MRCATSISTVLNPIPPAAILETGRDLAGQADAAINLPQEQRACVRRDGAAVESSCDFPAAEASEIEGILATPVGVGGILCSSSSLCRRRTFADSEPQCTYFS